jgi:hypothetical protein
MDWNLQASRWRERPKQNMEKNVLENAGKCGKTWSDVQKLAG